MVTRGEAQSGGGGERAPVKPASVTQAIATLVPKDALRAVQEATQWLESLQGVPDFALARRYEATTRVDAALKPQYAQLLDQYLALKPFAKFQEGLLWRTASAYWKALGHSYVECVLSVLAHTETAEVFRGEFPRLVARALRAHIAQIKWILMRYGDVSDVHWTTVARLYGYAEAGAFLDQPVDIITGIGGAEDEPGCGSVRELFLRAMVLGVSSTGGLSPAKQDMAERAIARFAKHFVSGAQGIGQCNFFFDLHGGMAPARILAEAPRGARLFYFGAGSAIDLAQSAVDAISEKGQLPPGLDLGAAAAAEHAADTLAHLAFHWEKELPARDAVRRKVATTLQIAPGFEGVLAQGNKSLHETWVVENVSREGYGVIVPQRRGEWLQVGVALGFLPETQRSRWGAAVVRRVETDARGQRRVGLQILSNGVVPGTLCVRDAAGERGVPHNAVLLAAEPSPSGYLQMMLPEGALAPGDAAMEVTRLPDGKTFGVTAAGVIESGPDFVRVRFKVSAEVGGWVNG